jgi:hypothetical protein
MRFDVSVRCRRNPPRSNRSNVPSRPPIEHEKEAFLFGKFEGRGYEESAEILGCSVGAVKVRIHRAMKALRVALGHRLLAGDALARISHQTPSLAAGGW